MLATPKFRVTGDFFFDFEFFINGAFYAANGLY
jgi:hypothetical protein